MKKLGRRVTASLLVIFMACNIILCNAGSVDAKEESNETVYQNDTYMCSKKIASVSLGGGHSAIITQSGELYIWGYNYYGQLGDGTQNGATASYGFVNSAEFLNSGLANDRKVDVFYNTFLNREADDAGKELWVDALNAGVDIEKVFEGFVMSTEFAGICNTYGIRQGQMGDLAGMADILNRYRNRNVFLTLFVGRCYEKALGRASDVAGVDVWCMQIIEGFMSPRNVAADGFFHSDEFINKNTSNGEYVSILYETFLGRELDEPGYELWVGLLDRNEWSRDEVLDGFAQSDEFAAILAGFGLN